MSKRFTDTEKWARVWFRKLAPKYKCAWIYVLDKCDHAGTWPEDYEAMSFNVCEEITREEFEKVFGDKVRRVDDDKLHIPTFIEFQYGCLNASNKVHKSVMDKLSKFPAPSKGLESFSIDAKDKDKDKDKDKEEDKDKAKEKEKEGAITFEMLTAMQKEERTKEQGIVCMLCTILREKNQDAKLPPNLNAWIRSADLMYRIDKRDYEESKDVLAWAQLDEFWQGNILSIPKFREKYETLRVRMKSEYAKTEMSDSELLRRAGFGHLVSGV